MDNDGMTIVVNDRTVWTDGGALDAATVLALAGMPEDAVVIRIDECVASVFDPERPLLFDSDASLAFRVFPDGAVHHLRVDGRAWDWGAPEIGVDDVRAIAGISEDDTLHLDGSEDPLDAGAIIDLAVAWPPRIEVRSRSFALLPAPVPVVINGRALTLDRPDVSFEDLVKLAFPDIDVNSLGSRSLTVSYRRGPSDRPEGSIISRQGVRAQSGEVFNVTATDKA